MWQMNGPALDEDDALLAEQAVGAGVVDEGRDVEARLVLVRRDRPRWPPDRRAWPGRRRRGSRSGARCSGKAHGRRRPAAIAASALARLDARGRAARQHLRARRPGRRRRRRGSGRRCAAASPLSTGRGQRGQRAARAPPAAARLASDSPMARKATSCSGRLGNGRPRLDIEADQLDVGALEQEVERRVGHHVAGRRRWPAASGAAAPAAGRR